MPSGIDDHTWELAKAEITELLGRVARQGQVITYSDLAGRLKTFTFQPNEDRFHHLLGEISRAEDDAGRGMLTVLVTKKMGSKEPGKGFYTLARELGRTFGDNVTFWTEELRRVHAAWKEPLVGATKIHRPANSPTTTIRPTAAYEPDRYWWVNQKQTYKQEIGGGYLWSPKRRSDGARNQFYENMREVSPGDLILSYWNGAIQAWGIARSYAYDSRRPPEYGAAGSQWSEFGYRVDVNFARLQRAVEPKKHWEKIKPLLPGKYSPLDRATGDGLQSVYLAELALPLGKMIVALINADGSQALPELRNESREDVDRATWEGDEERNVAEAPGLEPTEKQAVIMARRGQGRFRANVASVEHRCRITGIVEPEFLIASHIKPWRHSTNQERLDGNNGLLLAPHIDLLFDRGFISFEDDGATLLSPVFKPSVAKNLGIDPHSPPNVGLFNHAQAKYLKFHRDEIFRRVRV